MRKSWIFLLIFLLTPTGTILAQRNLGAVPAIVLFESNTDTVTVQQAENGKKEITFTWQAVNVREGDFIFLYVHRVSHWEIIETEANLMAQDSFTTILHQPLNFIPPTYKVAILREGRFLDEQVLTIPYRDNCRLDDSNCDPSIRRFDATSDAIDANDLAGGNALVSVRWNVARRLPLSNLVFEQILADGSTVNIELPRDFSWIPSRGAGALNPRFEPESEQIVLRLRVVNMLTGETYARERTTIPINAPAQSAAPPAPPVNPPTTVQNPPPNLEPKLTFGADPVPVAVDDTLTLSWTVTNASSVEVTWRDENGDTVVNTGLPIEGSLSVDVPTVLKSGQVAEFHLTALDENGEVLLSSTGSEASLVQSIPFITPIEIFAFSGSPNPAEKLSPVTLTWDVAGAESIAIVTASESNVLLPEGTYNDLPPSGEMTVRGSDENIITFFIILRDANGVTVRRSISVGLVDPPDNNTDEENAAEEGASNGEGEADGDSETPPETDDAGE